MHMTIRTKTLAIVVFACAALAAHAEAPASRDFQNTKVLALKSDLASQFRLAEMYDKGIGTERDEALAYLWYRKAAGQGHGEAKQRLEAMERNSADANQEAARTESVMRAMRHQEEAETARARDRERLAAEARAKRESELRLTRETEARAAEMRIEREVEARLARERTMLEKAAAASAAKPAKSNADLSPTVLADSPRQTQYGYAAKKPETAPVAKAPAEKSEGSSSFSANPCKGPTAKFLSTCQ